MNIFIVYYHPEPRSFNGAMLNTAISSLTETGHSVNVTNLHEMSFNPVSSRSNFTTVKDPEFFKPQLEELYATEHNGFSAEIEMELEKLFWCDLMIWQFPLWWFSLPAPLKGWVDRIFAMGRTYGMGRFYDNGMFKGKKAMLSLTTGGPADAYESDGFNGDINGILRPIQRGIFEFVGFSVLAPHIVYGPAHMEEMERGKQLDQLSERLRTIEREAPVIVGRY